MAKLQGETNLFTIENAQLKQQGEQLQDSLRKSEQAIKVLVREKVELVEEATQLKYKIFQQS